MVEQSPTGRYRRSHDADWSELSPEYLMAIGKRLENRTEVCKFRSICKKWRSSLPLRKNPRLLISFLPKTIYLPFYDNLFYHYRYNLVVSTVFHVQPLIHEPNSISKGWILTVEERKPGKLHIMNPLSRDVISMKNLKHINLLEFRVSEIGKGYLIRRIIDPRLDRNISIEGCKVVLCLNPAQKSVYATDCTAILLYSNGILIGFRLGNKNWGYVRQSLVLRFRDVLWFKGMVYAVDDGGRLYVIDHITLHVTENVVDHRILHGPHSFRLVESSNEIYLFVDVRKVYKLNRMQRKWDERKSLGGKAVFLGFDYCFMVSTQSLISHGGDFVLFNESILKDSYINKSEFKEVAKGLGIYIHCFAAGDRTNSQPDIFYQALCNLLWPPPSLFWQDKMLQVYSRDAGEKEKINK